jgi:hypothetical protein
MSPSSALRRLAIEWRDAVELLLLPGLAGILPWSICFMLFQRLARWQWLYREPCEAALVQARVRGWAGQDEAHWLWVRRLVTLVDHADHYLGLTRGDAWMRRHLQVTGQWLPPGQAAVLCTFHWGAGLWGLRHAAASGMHPHALVAPVNPHNFVGRRVLHLYVRSRVKHVSKTLGSPALDVSESLRPALRALRHAEPIMAAVDVPSDQVSASIPITLLGMQASVPRGLLRLAADGCIPVQIYVTGLNTQTGQRFLRIKSMGIHTDVNELVAKVFSELEQVIAEDAPAWHFWGIAERFFRSNRAS